MFTKKSLIMGFALFLSVICAGSVGAFASSVIPNTPKNAINSFPAGGIDAIPTDNTDDTLSPQNVLQYLHTQGFVGGPTVNGAPPVVENMKETDLSGLKKLIHLIIPGLQPGQGVYYTQLKGPFTLSQNLPLPVLSTLLPSANNLPILSNQGLLSQLPDLTSLPLVNTLTNGNLLNDGLLSDLPILVDGKSLNGLTGPVKPNAPGLGGLLASVYEVFDAHTGNLLAWG